MKTGFLVSVTGSYPGEPVSQGVLHFAHMCRPVNCEARPVSLRDPAGQFARPSRSSRETRPVLKASHLGDSPGKGLFQNYNLSTSARFSDLLPARSSFLAMNQKIITPILIGGFALIVALYVIIAILTGAGNSIGEVGKFGMIGCFLLGMFSPRGGVYLMIFLAGYSDLLKRTLILETQISLMDVAFVLGMAPMALAGAVIGLVTRKLLHRKFTSQDAMALGISTVCLVIGSAMGLTGGDIGWRSLRVVADYGAFAFLLFAIPAAFPDRHELVKLLKVTLWIFVPVAIYGIWQRIYGFAGFELDYLRTGLSTEDRQLTDSRIRPFSTLNAATSLTMVTAASVVYALICRRARKLSVVGTVFFFALYSFACFMTYTRVGWGVLVLSIFLIFILRSKLTTALMYLAGIACFAGVILNAELLRDRLPEWQTSLTGNSVSDNENQGLRIMTLSDRLIGFENMKIRENWAPFGIEGQGARIEGLNDRYSTTFSHDAFTGFLFRFGYIPLGAVMLFGALLLAWIHRELFRMPVEIRRYAEMGMAGAMGALASLATGGTVFQFPANIFFWMLVSLGMVCVYESRRSKSSRAPFVRVEKFGGLQAGQNVRGAVRHT